MNDPVSLVMPTGTPNEQLQEVLKRLQSLEGKVAKGMSEDRLSILAFSGSLDKMLATFVLATTAAASGMDVEVFFTFWGLSALRDAGKQPKKDFISRMFGWMLPRGMRRLPLSQMQMGGMGPAMIRTIMAKKRLASLEEMLQICRESGVRLYACEMSSRIMGISVDELIEYPNLEICGAATFLEKAAAGRVTLFI